MRELKADDFQVEVVMNVTTQMLYDIYGTVPFAFPRTSDQIGELKKYLAFEYEFLLLNQSEA